MRASSAAPSSSRSNSARKETFSSRGATLSVGSDSHQLMPISRARSTDAISRRILIVISSMSSRFSWMSPAITMPLSSTRSKMSARFDGAVWGWRASP
jgi:hypothetical protein